MQSSDAKLLFVTVSSDLSAFSLCVWRDSFDERLALFSMLFWFVCTYCFTPAEGGISALNLSSSSTYLVTPSYCHQLAAVSPSLFVATNEGGVVTLRDSLYGTCQEEVNSRLSHVKMVTSGPH